MISVLSVSPTSALLCLGLCACVLSHVQLFMTSWTIVCQTPLAFFRQEYWNQLPFSLPWGLPDPGIELASPAAPALSGEFFTTEPPGKLIFFGLDIYNLCFLSSLIGQVLFFLKIFSFFNIFLLCWKSHNIKHTILTVLNCTVQWHWVHSHCATLTIIHLPNISPS